MAAPGQAIGYYRVGAKLGAGGMGEVWQATDTRLNREVAIKMLPAAFAADPVSMERFRREAQVLASLNHPGIATIHGVEQNALVMELVEGPTLAERIAQGKLTLEEALPLAFQIADALEYAHERGIVHRDLKPANIKLTAEGRVKVLDFGLAKAVSADTGAAAMAEAVTLTTPVTLAGTIMGTAAYMAPEQARGKAVDRRADIWAFGVVVYEMLTGERPFAGEDITDMLAAVVKLEPDLRPLPEAARDTVARCLKKNPGERWGWIGDVRYALQHPAAAAAAAPAPARRASWVAAAGAAAAVVAAAALTWWLKPQPPREDAVVQFEYALPAGQTFSRVARHVLAISPDGREIAYTSGKQLWLRPLNTLAAQHIAGTAPDLYEPVFSPDGKWIAYFTPGSPLVLQKIPVAGGAPVTLCTLPGSYSDQGASWSDGRIVFGYQVPGREQYSIEQVSDAGGTPQAIATAAHGSLAAQPQLLDHGRRLLFTLAPRISDSQDADQIVIQDVGADASRRVVLTGGSNAHVLPDGQMVYIHDGTIFGIGFNDSAGAVAGSPVPLVVGVSAAAAHGGQFGVSANGTLVYWPGASGAAQGQQRQVAWVDAHGKQTPFAAPARDYRYPRVSPDGKLVAVSVQGTDGGLWVFDRDHATFSRLVIGGAKADFASAWSRDSRTLYYTYPAASGLHLYRAAADGASPPQDLGSAPGPLTAITPDASYGIFSGPDLPIFDRPLQPGGVAKLLISSDEYGADDGVLSPDGHWLAYLSTQTANPEIYVRPWPNLEAGRWQISNDQGVWPVWSQDGRTLYYKSNASHQMMAAAVQLQPTFSAGPPKALFVWTNFVQGIGLAAYGVAPDGRFVVIAPAGAAATGTDQAQSLVVVTHWDQEVAARVH